jgi:2-polyprenyl-3-methyl-5-hydroxy-6-metoxy-1,4-benzoquinol methylase
MTTAEERFAHPAERILRPGEQELLAAWRDAVDAHYEQEARLREDEPSPDFWEEVFKEVAIDIAQTNPMIESLRPLLRSEDAWLDVGAGVGQVALPLSSYVREVHALDPSPGCLDLMRGWIEKNRIENVRVLSSMFWPPEPLGRFDGCIAKHVHNFVADIGGFLDAMERHATRLCVIGAAELGTAFQPHHDTFEELHGEKFIRLPGVRELLAILSALRRRFEVQAFDFSQY